MAGDRHRGDRRGGRGRRARPHAQSPLVEEPRAAGRPLASLRALGATLADAATTRIELAVVELREEGERRKALLVLGVAGGVFLGMGLLLATFFVVVLFWETHRLAAIGAMTLLYLAIG